MLGLSLGATAHARETNSLVTELVNIFGSANISGLYIGDDLVTDSSKNVMSWPGRIGDILTNNNSNYFTTTTSASNHVGLYSRGQPINNCLVNLNINYKHVFCATSITTLPFGNYVSLVRDTAPVTFVLEGTLNASILRTPSTGQAYVDGFPTLTVTTGSHIFEWSDSTAISGSFLGGNQDGTYSWQDPMYLFLFLANQPTTAQRSAARTAIYKWQGKSDSYILQKEIAALYGPALSGVWVGDDIISTAGAPSSWPSQVSGSTLVPAVSPSPVARTLLTSNNYRYGMTNSQTETMSAFSGSLEKLAGVFAVASVGTLPFGNFRTMVSVDQNGTHEFLTGNSGLNTFFNDNARIFQINGTTTTTIPSTGSLLICESALTGAAISDNIHVCGSSFVNGAIRNWQGTIGTVIALNATASISQRSDTMGLLGKYYGFNAQNVLEMQLKSIFGTSLIGLWLGEDVVADTTGSITSWNARVGSNAVPLSTGLATKSTVFGRTCGVFPSLESQVTAYNAGGGWKTNIIVSSFRGPIPTTNHKFLFDATEVYSRFAIIGTTTTYQALASTFYQDTVVGNYAVDTNPHMLASTYVSASNNTSFGGAGSSALRNWWGNIWCVATVSSTATATQITAAYNVLKQYYTFLT